MEMDPENANEGVVIHGMDLEGKPVDLSSGSFSWYELNANDRVLILDAPLPPGSDLKIEMSWSYDVNRLSHLRTGRVDSTTWFIAYFFPRVAVYDDINGWNAFQYSGLAEFYNDFGDYQVSIKVPRNFVVWATGRLQDPETVLTAKYVDRLQRAWQSDSVIAIIRPGEQYAGVTVDNEINAWFYKAEEVTDFAFAVSDHYLWDASSMVVDSLTGRRVLIDAAYDQASEDFYEVAEIAREAIGILSFQSPGVPFPYPAETVFNGSDEMEYPMMVNDHSLEDMAETIMLTTHEISHTYLPFYLGINEARYAWMDEGWATFITYEVLNLMEKDLRPGFSFEGLYSKYAGTDSDLPLFVHSSMIKDPAYKMNSYPKAAAFLYVLRDLLGEDMFWIAYREFMNRWNGLHPTPYDMFFTLMDVTGEDLTWLINPWFFEYGDVDVAIGEIEEKEGAVEVVLQREGNLPVPVTLELTFEDGSTFEKKYDVSIN